jgi:biopolymer transport protein ExbB/TolQ
MVTLTIATFAVWSVYYFHISRVYIATKSATAAAEEAEAETQKGAASQEQRRLKRVEEVRKIQILLAENEFKELQGSNPKEANTRRELSSKLLAEMDDLTNELLELEK